MTYPVPLPWQVEVLAAWRYCCATGAERVRLSNEVAEAFSLDIGEEVWFVP